MATFRVMALITIMSFFAACGSGTGNTNSNRVASRPDSNLSAAKTNAEELGLLVKLPYQTEDIAWKEIPAKKRVIAVLRFSTVNANKIAAEAGGTMEKVVVPVESWFPEELVAQSEMSGNNTVKGTAYPATAFFQEPYTVGKIIRVEGSDYFILDLSTK